jgi:hypothetical protein
LNTWADRDGNVIGAVVFLTPEEVERAREEGNVEIEIK